MPNKESQNFGRGQKGDQISEQSLRPLPDTEKAHRRIYERGIIEYQEQMRTALRDEKGEPIRKKRLDYAE